MSSLKKEKEISKIIKGTAVNYMSSSTIHGFSNIVRSTNIIQGLIWILIVLSGSGYSFYVIRNYIVEYLDYPTVTKTEIVKEPIPEFPNVRICDFELRDTSIYFGDFTIHHRNDLEISSPYLNYVGDGCYDFNSGKYHSFLM